MANFPAHLQPLLSGIPGLALRPPRLPEDFPALTEIINLSSTADQVEEYLSVEEVTYEYEHLPNCDLKADMLLAELESRPVAFTRVWWREDLEGNRQLWHLAYTRAEGRRRGLGRLFVAWNEWRLQEIHAALGPLTRPGAGAFFQAFVPGKSTGACRLLEEAGYTPARYFFFMQRPNLAELPPAPLPEGLEFRPVRPEHLPAIWETKEEAFRDHWGYAPKTRADYEAWEQDPANDLDLWVAAWEGERIAGVSLNAIYPEDNARYGFLRGMINTLAVRRAYRKRGLGRALLVESMRRLHARGMTEATLGVDAANLTGALRLYESVGFRELERDVVYRKGIAPGG